MLMQMRKSFAKIFTIVLFGLIILSFAFWGVGDIVRGGHQVQAVAEVGGVEIDEIQFSRSLGREMNALRQRFGTQFDATQAQAFGVVDQVLERLINQALFERQSADMRLVVSDDQIREQIREAPAFQNNLGDFERARFFQLLQAQNMSEQDFVDSLSRDIKRDQIVQALSGAAEAPEVLARQVYAYEQERRVAEILLVAADSLPALGDPGEEDLENTHRENALRFQSPEYRDVALIHLTAERLVEDFPVTEEAAREEFEARREEFRVPERRHVDQIVFPTEAQAKDAKSRVDGGAAFAAVSQAILEKPAVNLGSLTREDLAEPLDVLAEPVFSLAEGAISDPVESPFGWHLLHVKKIEPGREPDFAAAREEIMEDLSMRLAVDHMVDLTNQLDDELGSGATLAEAADLLALELRRITVDANGRDTAGEAVPDLPPLDEFVREVFGTEAGESSLLVESRDGSYFVAQVDGITPAATRPLDEVRDDVETLWRENERDRLGREKAEALAQRVRDGESLAAVAESEGLELTRGEAVTRQQSQIGGRPARELVARLFELNPDEVATVATESGHVVLTLAEVQPADAAAEPEAVAQVQQRLAPSLQGDLLQGFISALRRDYGVEVNHGVVQRTVSNL